MKPLLIHSLRRCACCGIMSRRDIASCLDGAGPREGTKEFYSRASLSGMSSVLSVSLVMPGGSADRGLGEDVGEVGKDGVILVQVDVVWYANVDAVIVRIVRADAPSRRCMHKRLRFVRPAYLWTDAWELELPNRAATATRGWQAETTGTYILTYISVLRAADLCESQSCSVLTVSGAPVGTEEVDARVILLGVGLVTLLYA